MVPERFAPSVRLAPAFQSYYSTVLLPESFLGVAPSALYLNSLSRLFSYENIDKLVDYKVVFK
jgi:hypothetical protein